ncbi:MAG: sel1 repeat family protein, partial [Clostridia bacterium]|nr:sel1 repeat family protein [Clostridia bacterium]
MAATNQYAKYIAQLEHGAKKGDPCSQYELGDCYFNGTKGLAKDYKAAANLFTQSAQKKYSKAQLMLGTC